MAPEGLESARAGLLREFRWSAGGHADLWRLFSRADLLAALVEALAAPWQGVTHVVGIEARGFLLGGAVAVRLGAGFQGIRKGDGLLPGPTLTARSEPDYRDRSHDLRMQATLGPGDVALLVDDWAERGSQARAARDLVVGSGADFAGVSLLVDQLDEPARASLGRVTAVVRAAELPPYP